MLLMENLFDIGYSNDNKGNYLDPEGEIIPSFRLANLKPFASVLSNIRYMARAIDRYDGIEDPAPGTLEGDQQFDHLLRTDPSQAISYFALRRLQRANDLSGIRRGIVIMRAFERQELLEADLKGNLWPKESDLPLALIKALQTPDRRSAA